MMQRKKLGLALLPATLAIAVAAGPVLAQGTSGTTGSGTTTTPPGRTAPGTAPTPGSPTGTTVPEITRGAQTTTPGTGSSASTSTYGTTATGLAANAVLTHRPRMSQLIGTNVYNENNETIGEVDDILLGGVTGMPGTGMSGTGATSSGTTGTTMPGTSAMRGGMEPMAVIQVGGFLGIGARLVTVPLSELQWNAERDRIVLPHATKETLQSRPAFSYDALRRG
jgi:hypothetical protein